MLHPRPTDRRSSATPLTRARWLLMGLFALQGLTFASWLARLPAVRDALGMSPSELGVVLLAGAVGGLLTVAVAGMVVARFGGLVTLNTATAAFAASFLLLGIGPALGSTPLLVAGVFLGGVSAALGNVPLNVESAAVERRMGRSVLPQFHAVFSIGAVLGSLAGAVTAHFEISLLTQFAVTAVVGAAIRLASSPHVILDTPSPRGRAARAGAAVAGDVLDGVVLGHALTPGADPAAHAIPLASTLRGSGLRTALAAWREPRTLLIGLVIMAAALSEGAANDWVALAVVDGFDQAESVGAAFFGMFLAAMTAVRLLGTRLLDRHDPVLVLRISGIVSLVGLLLFGFAPTLPLAGVGVVAWGLGAALAFPIGISAASADPLRAAGRVAVISAFASIASLAAPPLLGIVAESLGTRRALVLITIAMVISVSLARHVAPADSRDLADSTRPAGSGEPETWGRPVTDHAVGASEELTPAGAIAAGAR
ncbi:MFS transporter [Pengzhenrongella frigida]|uniref:MFS transporter n=1 Tax=Pengzhenrongella frigida TaxID=1259133 RepID=A0A4V1ZH76_9MICO|nr:MFS transporter [Cellulomonas sp. HLT2-17]RYV51074.1 MFS transporter [Cellulomonas sp. HLT2-17]